MSQPDDDLTPHRPVWGLWLTLGGVAVVMVLAILTTVRAAGVVLAVHLAVLGAVRLVASSPGPFGITVRSRLFDVAFLWLGAIGIALMTLTADNL
ncbi:MAG TPA: DUF3017 domain-containing protein [Beutenbergiaceae bacterium]|nr:DUF3017 domain-containing protein [Beutenbergiaceae bacterium]